MLVEITAYEVNDVLIKLYCQTSAASGAFQLPRSVVDALRNATDVSIDLGLSDEVQMQVGAIPVLLTTVYHVALMGFR